MALCMSMSQTFFLLTQWLPIFSTKFTIFPEIKVSLVAKNILVCKYVASYPFNSCKLQQLAASYKGFYVWKKTLGSSVTLSCFHSNPCGLIHYFQTAIKISFVAVNYGQFHWWAKIGLILALKQKY